MSTVAVSSGGVIAATVTSGVAIAGAAIVGVGMASYRAYEYLSKEAEEYLAQNNKIIDSLDSPFAMAELAMHQKEWLMANPYFLEKTKGLSKSQLEQLAGAYAVANSPLEVNYTDLVLKKNQHQGEELLSRAALNMGESNYQSVSNKLEQTANEFGFVQSFLRFSNGNSKVWTFQKKDNDEQMTVVVSKDPKNHATTMAIDLHGFDCNTDRCLDVMSEFEQSLVRKGLKFTFKKERHNLPEGKLLKKLKTTKSSSKTAIKKKIIRQKEQLKSK
ncbi:hypothetical protein SAMN06298216_3542 [Spirosomataceae bacterium TFI 002]|nr:hypothetical protein SAMN06298216_3542 [Spirosomataceae bacterium TFI 002]